MLCALLEFLKLARTFTTLINDPTENANQVGKTIGYSEEVLNSVPKNSNLGVGCGNPSAMADIKSGQTVIDLGSGAGFDAFIISRILGNDGLVLIAKRPRILHQGLKVFL